MKKYINKFILGSLTGAALMGLGACTNLDEEICDQIAAEKYEFTNTEAQAMLAPVFDAIYDIYSMNGIMCVQDECTDLWCIPARLGVGWGTYYIKLHDHGFHDGISHCRNIWNYCYSGIASCNSLLENQAVTGSEQAAAQIRGYRAFFYYMLFDLFRYIPLDKSYTHEDGWLATQADPQESWDWIISELNDIKDKVGESNGFGKINKAAINMILAKMYLNHNAWTKEVVQFDPSTKFTASDTYYQKAIDEVQEIINGGQYSLAANYTDCFKNDISGCKEIIFGLPAEQGYNSWSSMTGIWMNLAGMARWGGYKSWATGGGAGLPQFIESYDEDDQRLSDCWIYGQQYDQSGAAIMSGGEPLIYTLELTNINGCYPMEGARMTKWEYDTNGYGTLYVDLPIFRYADALMIKAECLLRLGSYKGENKQTAADLVSQVRARDFADSADAQRTVADLEGGSVYPYGMRYKDSKDDGGASHETHEGGDDIILGGLLDDLAWEFLHETHRRQDLIRFELTTGGNVFNMKSWFSKQAETNAKDYHKDVFPIHKTPMASNPNLKQTPGY